MRYLVLACDYDNTLAGDGRIDAATLAALDRCAESGRKVVLVTGRELDDLLRACSCIDRFEWVVAENGAVLYRPANRQERILAESPPPQLVETLRARGAEPLSHGRVIVSTWHPHETTAVKVIRDLGLELEVIFNRGAVMILPAGVTKASGLLAALAELGVSPHNTVAVGDGENDHALLSTAEVAVAVGNAIPTLRERADLVTHGDLGAGVAELIDRLIRNDLADLEPRLHRYHILLGHRDDGSEVRIPPYGTNVLVAGTSGGGKSTVATALMERLAEAQYQFAVIDPEGDYQEFDSVVPAGSQRQPPEIDFVMRLLETPAQNVAVNMIGVSPTDRPTAFLNLLAQWKSYRSRTGRPHWILIDEAHHVMPVLQEYTIASLVERLETALLITLEPDQVARSVLAQIDWVIAVGDAPQETFGRFSRAVNVAAPAVPNVDLERGELMVWCRDRAAEPFRVRLAPGQAVRRRHVRKYAHGELPPDHVFYFRGPEGRLNLPAQNLMIFLQIAQGLDDETWQYHFDRGDYSRWMREAIKDPELAAKAAEIEADRSLSPQAGRERFRELIEGHYTLPATGLVAPLRPEESG